MFVINWYCTSKSCAKAEQQFEHYKCLQQVLCLQIMSRRKKKSTACDSLLWVIFSNFTTVPSPRQFEFIWLPLTDAKELKMKVVKHSKKFNFVAAVQLNTSKSFEALQHFFSSFLLVNFCNICFRSFPKKIKNTFAISSKFSCMK